MKNHFIKHNLENNKHIQTTLADTQRLVGEWWKIAKVEFAKIAPIPIKEEEENTNASRNRNDAG